jgi:hypothetical protein
VTIPAGQHVDQFGAPVASGPRVLAPLTALIVLGPPS